LLVLVIAESGPCAWELRRLANRHPSLFLNRNTTR
jgi:hypothetical protein